MECKNGEVGSHDISITRSTMYFMQIISIKKVISLKATINLNSQYSVNPSGPPGYLHSSIFSNVALITVVYNPIHNIYFLTNYNVRVRH
jgi:hypothetical protein